MVNFEIRDEQRVESHGIDRPIQSSALNTTTTHTVCEIVPESTTHESELPPTFAMLAYSPGLLQTTLALAFLPCCFGSASLLCTSKRQSFCLCLAFRQRWQMIGSSYLPSTPIALFPNSFTWPLRRLTLSSQDRTLDRRPNDFPKPLLKGCV